MASAKEDPAISCYVFVKNLKDGKRNVVKSDKIWIIEEVSKDSWKRTKLRIADVDIFKAYLKDMKTKSKAPIFGIVSGESMVKHFIIDFAVDVKMLQSSVAKSRVKVPPRVSLSDSYVPLKYFLKHEEKSKAAFSKKASDKFKSDSALGKRVKASVHNESVKRLKKVEKASKELPAKCDAPLDTVDTANKQQTMPSQDVVSSLEGKGSFSTLESQTEQEISEGFVELVQPKASANVQVIGNLDLLPTVTKSCQQLNVCDVMPKFKFNYEDTTSALKEKIRSLTDQRDQAMAENIALRLQMDVLKSDLKDAKMSHKTILEEIAANVKKLPAKVTHAADREESSLKTLVFAHHLEEDLKDFEVPDNQVYVGNGKTISRQELLDIEEDYKTVNQRAENVFNLMCPDGIGNYTCKGHLSSKKFKVMPDHVISSLKKILKSMTWSKSNAFDIEVFSRNFLQKHPGDVRRRGKKKDGNGAKVDDRTEDPTESTAATSSNETTGNQDDSETEEVESAPKEDDAPMILTEMGEGNQASTSSDEEYINSEDLDSIFSNFSENE